MKMKKNLILVLFIFLSTFGFHVSAENLGVVRATKEQIETPRSVATTTIRLNDEKKAKISKKDLKDEIKRRKKHHKALLSIYNESFDPEYLKLIEENSLKLLSLRELLSA